MSVASIVWPTDSRPSIEAGLVALTYLDSLWLRGRDRTQILRAWSRVRYQREPLGQEIWQTLPILLEHGAGDCEDLACADAALFGGRAVARRSTAGWHILVERAGRLVDPSREKGM